jgi:hypothetical protein
LLARLAEVSAFAWAELAAYTFDETGVRGDVPGKVDEGCIPVLTGCPNCASASLMDPEWAIQRLLVVELVRGDVVERHLIEGEAQTPADEATRQGRPSLVAIALANEGS